MKTLNKKQLLTWQTAYDFQKQDPPKYLCCFGNLTKEKKAFLSPFIKAGYIDENHLKFAGVFKLTTKGITKFEEILNSPQLEF